MAKDPILARIAAAKADKQKQAYWIDESLRLMLPTYRRINDSTGAQTRNEQQDDLFDTTLQEVGEDFASDMIQTFTPRYERWVTMKPATDLSEGQQREIAPQLQELEDMIFGELERSNYWSAAQEAFAFWGVSNMAVAMSDMGPLNPIHFQVIEPTDLLLERGPDGSLSGRWRKMKLDDCGLNVMWPALFPAPSESAPKSKMHEVVEGCDRDWSTPGLEAWNYRIFVDGKEKQKHRFEGPGSAPIIACRFKQQVDTAWGPGPVLKATPKARTLDELAYLNLKALGKSVDPPVSYEEDGVTNVEGGVGPGDWIPRATNSKEPKPFEFDVRFDAMIFNVDNLRKGIRRDLYQDRPEQEGLTPPTATQWTDEKFWQTRRRELPRDRCVTEWVLPIIERVAFILKQRGVLPEVKLQGGKLIDVRPVSPLSKAKDLEDVQVSSQLLSMAAQVGQAVQAGVPIDANASILNLKATLKERNIVMLTAEQIADAAAQAQEAGLIGGVDGQPAA